MVCQGVLELLCGKIEIWPNGRKVEILNRDSHYLDILSGETMPTVSTIWWNHAHCIYYLVKPCPLYLLSGETMPTVSTIWWNHAHCIYYLVKPCPLYLLSGETMPTVSTIWWNHAHCIYYLVKPCPLYLLSGETTAKRTHSKWRGILQYFKNS